MAYTTSSPNMLLPVPVVGQDPGPQYATDINNCLTIIDQHDHSAGSGVPVPASGININGDLPFNGANATLLRTARFSPQASVLALATDLNCAYSVNGDLYYNDAAGNKVRITQSGGVAGSPGSISNLTSPASVAYVAANQTYVFQSAANTSANLDGASVLLRNLSANSFALTLSPPAAMGGDYAITLPAAPASTKLLTMTSAGVMAANAAADGTTIQLSSGVLSVVQSSIGSPGEMKMFAGTVIPSGWVLCDGGVYNRTTNAALFAAIGTAWGAPSGTTFNVPDMRGLFPRGVDPTGLRDGDAASRTALNSGGNAGAQVGSYQGNGVSTSDLTMHDPGHSHTYNGNSTGSGTTTSYFQNINPTLTGTTNSATTGVTVTGTASDTRPKNAYVNFIIKT